MANPIKQAAKVDWRIAGSVVAGVALFGTLVWAIRRLPNNAITEPVKKAADIASAG